MPKLPSDESFQVLNRTRIRVERAIKELESAQNQLGLDDNQNGGYLLSLVFKALVECYVLVQAIKRKIEEDGK